MPADYRHDHDARTKRLATLGFIFGVISISLFPQFVCMLATRFAVVPLPESLIRIGFLALAIGFCLACAARLLGAVKGPQVFQVPSGKT